MVQTKYIPMRGEEGANAITHGITFLLTLFALPFALVWAYTHVPESVCTSVTVSIFVTSIFSDVFGLYPLPLDESGLEAQNCFLHLSVAAGWEYADGVDVRMLS